MRQQISGWVKRFFFVLPNVHIHFLICKNHSGGHTFGNSITDTMMLCRPIRATSKVFNRHFQSPKSKPSQHALYWTVESILRRPICLLKQYSLAYGPHQISTRRPMTVQLTSGQYTVGIMMFSLVAFTPVNCQNGT